MFQRKGFTLIELIMVVAILGILAVVAIPKYYDLTTDAKTAAEKGVVGGVRSGIATYLAQNKTYPAALDSASTAVCATSNACFDTVLGQGGVTTSDWTKASATTYTGPTATTYTYNSTSGGFQ
jgi:prepilin-type N-terminal cleavage/methylation domain-containing protein